MNDYWDYLEHGWLGKNGQKGSEKKNHKYYARVPTGTKDGHNVYRYFYSKEDYAAYIRSGKKKLTGEYGMEKHPNGGSHGLQRNSIPTRTESYRRARNMRAQRPPRSSGTINTEKRKP